MAHRIVPAHDPRVTVIIEIPVQGRKTPLLFKAPRMDFLPKEHVQAFDEWYTARLKDEEAGTTIVTETMLLDWWVKELEMKEADKLLALTHGEKTQIWTIWNGETRMTLGESAALSGSSDDKA